MLQFGIFLIAFIGLVIELIKLSQKNNHSQLLTE
ncbi:putative holin-like toxin [Staphylococcus epidermidis]|nr:putative holin-like toxin [Staphylococcus epidermidis]